MSADIISLRGAEVPATKEEHTMTEWIRVATLEDIPRLGARVVRPKDGTGGANAVNIAVFRNAEDEVFALEDKCPHKGGPLSQGIVHGRHVTCPLHGWNIALFDGNAVAPDKGCSRPFATRVEDGVVYLQR